MLSTMPHLPLMATRISSGVMQPLGDHQGWQLWLGEGTGKPSSGGGLCHSSGSQSPIASCLQTQHPTNPSQLLARANLPKTEAPGRHWESEGFRGMGREQCFFFLGCFPVVVLLLGRGGGCLAHKCFRKVCGHFYLMFCYVGALLHAEKG